VSLPEQASQLPPNTAQVVTPFGQNLLRFVHLIHQDQQYADEPLLKSCVGLIGDLCSVPGMAQEMTANEETKHWIAAFLKRNADIEQRTFAYTKQRLGAIGIQ
jgi:hypothetical protein